MKQSLPSVGTAAARVVDAKKIREPKGYDDHPFQKSREYILALARSFPCLDSKVARFTWSTWDVDKFMDGAAVWSSGEVECARFVAMVWNPGYAQEQGWTIDLMKFASTADIGNRQPVIEWLITPIFP